MSSAINHAKRSHRSYAVHKSIAGASGRKTWIRQAGYRKRADVKSIFQGLLGRLRGGDKRGS